ncbi:MAG: hypothetical protein ACO1N9_05475 [Flavobacterium sp.]
MTFDYEQLERDLTIACDAVHKDFLLKFKDSVYVSAGGSKLDAFMNELGREFEEIAVEFLRRTGRENDVHAKKRALSITKLYAKKCIEDFSRVDDNLNID